MAEIDRAGNVNVSRFGPRLAGAGGFINISQNARRLVFAGTFTTGDLSVVIEDGRVRIAAEGKKWKFVEAVEQITFSGPLAVGKGQSVYYVTERCVFALRADGLQLVEVAPGIDIERDILAHMGFKPVIGKIKVMEACIYKAGPMGLSAILLDLQLSNRLSYDRKRNVLFANFEGMKIRSMEDIESVRRILDAMCTEVGRRVALIANYDDFHVDESLSSAYFMMVGDLQAKHYTKATRYTTSAFMRAKLGAELASRHAGAHVFETQAEAAEFLRRLRDNGSPAD
jgi:propionate CoA-transferase